MGTLISAETHVKGSLMNKKWVEFFFFAKFLHIVVKIRSAYRQTDEQAGGQRPPKKRILVSKR
jgi:hypothetical protein